MTFLYPLGLLGLIGIPILIIIYLIKSRYTEQTVPSTYLWTLSERFLKRKNPFSALTGIISLILQILLVTVLSLAIAHPVITLPGAAREYCFIIDGSGSMQTAENGVSRFDAAKEKVVSLINESQDGSVYSLMVVKDNTEVVYELSDNKKQAINLIGDLQCSDGEISYVDALGVAQGYFNENPSVLTYLITDTGYGEHQNIEIINVASAEANFSLSDVAYSLGTDGRVSLNGKVNAYGDGGLIDLAVYVDGSQTVAKELKLQPIPQTPAEFSFELELEDFDSLEVKILSADSNPLDNTAKLYNLKSENAYDALLVSDAPFFLESALKSVSNADVTVMSTAEYAKKIKILSDGGKKIGGYGLYVFDGYTPDYMPEDGSVWLIGLAQNLEGAGYSVQGEVVIEDGYAALEMTTKSSYIVKTLTANMTGSDVAVSKYVKCGLYSNFTTLYSYMGNPMIFTGLNEFSNREVVFSFSLHNSDFVLSPDYPILVSNLLEYSFPDIIEKTEYTCGEMAEINVISGCESIRVTTPKGEVFYTDTATAVSEFKLTEVGEYRISVDVSGNEREFRLYSSLPKGESNISPADERISLTGEATDGGRDGKYDKLAVYFIIAAILFSAEWVVYCYDKYQLR